MKNAAVQPQAVRRHHQKAEEHDETIIRLSVRHGDTIRLDAVMFQDRALTLIADSLRPRSLTWALR